MFTKGVTLDDGTDVQFVVNDIPEGLRFAVVIARKNEDGSPKEAHLFHITITDPDELEAIEAEVYNVDVRLHPERYEDDDDGEDDGEDDGDDDDDDGDGDDDDDDGDSFSPEDDDDDELDELDPSEQWKRSTVRDLHEP